MIHTNKKGEWFELVIPAEWEKHTLETLFKDFWKAPKKMVHLLRTEKNVLINGNVPDWTLLLKKNDRLSMKLFTEEDIPIIPEYLNVDIIYEDDHLIVFNKPAGMDTHPNELGQVGTLANAAAFHMQSNGEITRSRHIHRLDRETTGAVLFAKNSFITAILDKMLEERAIKRTYLALADGIIKQKKGTINKPIGRDRHHPTRRRVSETGQQAITHFKVLEQIKQKDLTLVQCTLDTGRTHQIRVHFSAIGHPLAGDSLYGGSDTVYRQALHAVKMEFTHPFTQEKIICHAPFIDKSPIFFNIDPYEI
ncbi:RluA family pseudouridine synthase [Mesobacillus subterraneus]|uniref:RluA family pseudouridine synthase n=1 Tax=Mesobacillus subterraneus TaxID=285983 RepID=UPI001CFEF89E|nr:RluA family pseudouridine synthase [Mesobacillus subterraneus]WLR54032.1 RluA family pseudouridine synthase [Mesobacillus subterraneus]